MRNTAADELNLRSTIVATRSGGYYTKILSHKLVYVEECMFDTAIEDFDVWQVLSELSIDIESESSVATRMELRRERIRCFLEYEYKLETETLELIDTNSIALMSQIMIAVLQNADDAVAKARRRYL